jgi:hypothetical protein
VRPSTFVVSTPPLLAVQLVFRCIMFCFALVFLCLVIHVFSFSSFFALSSYSVFLLSSFFLLFVVLHFVFSWFHHDILQRHWGQSIAAAAFSGICFSVASQETVLLIRHQRQNCSPHLQTICSTRLFHWTRQSNSVCFGFVSSSSFVFSSFLLFFFSSFFFLLSSFFFLSSSFFFLLSSSFLLCVEKGSSN